MKRTSNILGLVALVLVASACSGAQDDLLPFESGTDLASRLAADLGCPAYVGKNGGHLFVAVQGESRVIAPPSEKGVGDAVKVWASRYASDLFTLP